MDVRLLNFILGKKKPALTKDLESVKMIKNTLYRETSGLDIKVDSLSLLDHLVPNLYLITQSSST